MFSTLEKLYFKPSTTHTCLFQLQELVKEEESGEEMIKILEAEDFDDVIDDDILVVVVKMYGKTSTINLGNGNIILYLLDLVMSLSWQVHTSSS